MHQDKGVAVRWLPWSRRDRSDVRGRDHDTRTPAATAESAIHGLNPSMSHSYPYADTGETVVRGPVGVTDWPHLIDPGWTTICIRAAHRHMAQEGVGTPTSSNGTLAPLVGCFDGPCSGGG